MSDPSSVDHLPELMAILAHDMRNPLSALLTNIHFVQSVAKGSQLDVDEALSDSVLSCMILGQVIGNLEVLGRAFGGARLAPTLVSTREAAGHAVARAAPQAVIAGIDLRVAAGDETTVFVDPVFFGRAIDNVVANALQYSPAKGKIALELIAKDGRGGVAVLDGGPVVPPEFREAVLTQSGQAEAKKRYEARYGRGLGLFCAAQAARISGGELTITESNGRFCAEIWGPLSKA
ncbi:MAG: HAMP domain-containing sensor histidine kinase [Polyangiaceae bacterium]